MILRPCHHCGKDVKVSPSRDKRNGRIFCNEICCSGFLPYRAGRLSPLFGKEQARGGKSHRWKGGIIYNNGYTFISFALLPENERILFAPHEATPRLRWRA